MDQIIVVDDDRSHLLKTTAILKHDGYQCMSTTDPNEAISMSKQYASSFVVTDYNMPDCDGISLFKKMRTEKPYMRGLLVSSALSLDKMSEMMHEGFDDALPKPLDSDMLLSSVKRSLSIITHWRLRFHLMRKGETSHYLREAVGASLTSVSNPGTLSKHLLTQQEVDDLIQREWKGAPS